MTSRGTLLVGAWALAIAVVASVSGLDRADSAEADRSDARPAYRRTRFSAQTSSVWRYGQPFVREDLAPVPNNTPLPVRQPHRDRPERLALSAAGDKLYVTLPGTEEAPGDGLAVVDMVSKQRIRRVRVGLRPYLPVLHPGGRFLVVTNELSNYASVLDTRTDAVVGEIALDFYCQSLVFSQDGTRAWVANRYLDQVLVLAVQADGDSPLTARVIEQGGFDEAAFFGAAGLSQQLRRELALRGLDDAALRAAADRPVGGVNGMLRARCGGCHGRPAGGFLAGADPVDNFLSAVENSIGGQPYSSHLIRAVTPTELGGFGDQRRGAEFHPGGAVFQQGDPDLALLVRWIDEAEGGPGIPVGNPGSHPKDLALSADGRHLYVGNTGTMDVSVVDVDAGREVGAIYVQNVAGHVAIVPDAQGARDQLVVLTMGAGFGAAKARDPHGAETWDRDHPQAQFTVLRDRKTTDSYPIERQAVLGPFEAVDGTWNFKMRDIQNDLVAVDLSRLRIPSPSPGDPLDYLLHANRYEAHDAWVRYTSDTAEATTGDIKVDIPPELQRVPGAVPEWAAVVGDRLFVTMSGTSELVEWQVLPDAPDPAGRLVPVRLWETGLRPIGVVANERYVVVANRLSETVSIIDRTADQSRLSQGRLPVDYQVVVGDVARPPLDTDEEKGELVVHTSLFSSDGDSSCLHCHYRDTGDGRGWGAAETVGQDRSGDLTPGGTLGIPQMRNIFPIQPYYFEGTHRLSEGQGADINEPASSIDFDRPVWAGDFTHIASPIPAGERRLMHEELKERVSVVPLGDRWYDLEERRNEFIRHQSMRHFGAAYGLKDLYRFVAAWLGNTPHLLPSPFDAEHPAVRRGERIFNDAQVMCGVCHTPPEFTNKGSVLTHNDRRALPPLTTISRRDASYTLASVRAVEVANGADDLDLHPEDPGRVEDVEGSFTTMQLRGLFDRPPTFLHHGRARSLREVICTPDHPALRRTRLPVMQGIEEVRPGRLERGFNETTGRQADGALNPADRVIDTHGGTSHLGPRQIDDLVAFMRSIQ